MIAWDYSGALDMVLAVAVVLVTKWLWRFERNRREEERRGHSEG